MKKYAIILFTLLAGFLTPLRSYGQENVDFQVIFLTNEIIAEVNFDSTEFLSWARSLTATIEQSLSIDTTRQDILLLITLSKENDAQFKLSSRPAMSANDVARVTGELRKTNPPAPRTKVVDFSFLFSIALNGGCPDQAMDYTPEMVYPHEKLKTDFYAAGLEKKVNLIKEFARNEALPVLAAFTENAGEKFVGVTALGNLLHCMDYTKPNDVVRLTENSNDYWRAVIEMSEGNQLIPAIKIFLHAANGEFDFAQRYITVVQYLSDDKTLAHYMIDELMWRLDTFCSEYNKEVQKGIALSDAADYDKSIEKYNSLLSIYPNSAWANYEVYFTKSLKDTTSKNARALWDKSKPVIYRCDPMYPMDVRANNGREGYLLFRRGELNDLFRGQGDFYGDLVKYADIALDLAQYGFAAQMYWLILSAVPKEKYGNRDLFPYYIYCLDKLGAKETVKLFKDEVIKEARKIEKERTEIMENSETYKAFKKK